MPTAAARTTRGFNPAADRAFWDTATKHAFATLQHDFASGWKIKANAALVLGWARSPLPATV